MLQKKIKNSKIPKNKNHKNKKVFLKSIKHKTTLRT